MNVLNKMNDFISKMVTDNEVVKVSKKIPTSHFDFLFRFAMNGKSLKDQNIIALGMFIEIIKNRNFFIDELHYLNYIYNFLKINKEEKINITYSDNIAIGFKIEDNLIYMSLPLIYVKKDISDNMSYNFKNINIVISDDSIIVNNKKVKNLKNYLIYKYLNSYSEIMKDIFNTEIVFNGIEENYLNNIFNDYNNLIKIINH